MMSFFTGLEKSDDLLMCFCFVAALTLYFYLFLLLYACNICISRYMHVTFVFHAICM